MSVSILVASSSPFRRSHYCEQLRQCGYDVHTADGGVSCLEEARRRSPDVVLLEVSLPWGGSDGVLALRDSEPSLQRAAVVVIEAARSLADLYQLGQVSDGGFFLFRRLPSRAELIRTIEFGLQQRQLALAEEDPPQPETCASQSHCTESPAGNTTELDAHLQ